MKNSGKKKRRAASLLLFAACTFAAGAAPAAWAHHGGTFHDNSKVVTLNGTVNKFQWINPHIQILIDVPGPQGDVQHWTVEYTSPAAAARQGWSSDMMKPGDKIVYQVHPAKNGAYGARGAAKMIVNGKIVGDVSAAF